jgi:drug/metabolite transporter (DMT)-like permease
LEREKNFMKNKLALLFLLLIMLSGINTPLTKSIMDVVPPIFNVGLRFLIAFAVMFVLRPKKILRGVTRSDLVSVFIISIFMVLGYVLWNVSMLFTTATNATFFACTSVLFIPFLAKVINKTVYSHRVLVGIIITVVGMFLLISNGAAFVLNPGDLLALVASILFALQVIYTGKYVERIDPFMIASYQFLFVGVLAIGLSFVVQEDVGWGSIGGLEIAALLFAGILITAAMYYVQTLAQQKLSENTVGVLYALIPLFGAIFSWIILGESLSLIGIAGGGMMILGVVLAAVYK